MILIRPDYRSVYQYIIPKLRKFRKELLLLYILYYFLWLERNSLRKKMIGDTFSHEMRGQK